MNVTDLETDIGPEEDATARADNPEGQTRPWPAIKLVTELLAAPPPIPEDVVCGILHRGSKLVLGGGSKTFKSWCLLDLALSVASGVPWLAVRTCPAPVLFVNLEIGEPFLAHRLAAIARAKGITPGPSLSVLTLRGFCASYGTMLPKITQEAKNQFALIILDPSYKLLGSADENSARDITGMLNAVEELAVTTGAAVAFGAHFAKGNAAAKESLDRISGSGVFARDPDSILTLTRHEEANAFSIEMTLRNHAPLDPFVVRWDYPLLRRDDALDPARLKATKGRPSIYDAHMLLNVLGTATMPAGTWQRAVEHAHGMSRAKFHELRHELIKQNKVEQNSGGLWKAKNGMSCPVIQ